MKGVVITAIYGIGPFPKVEVIEIIVVWTDDDWFGGRKPTVVAAVERLGGFLEEVAAFVSIAPCDTT
jgi:hypothetical protein